MVKVDGFMLSTAIVLFSCVILTVADELPTCQPHDFHYEYTECDSSGGRWRVSVPDPKKCTGGAPNPPIRGTGCDFTCNEGEYLDVQGDQACHPCPAGTYSLGGGVRFDDWDKLPSGFATEVEPFTGPAYMAGWGSFSRKVHVTNRVNCTARSGWAANGKSLSTQVNPGCRYSLIYTANLVRSGSVRFNYQYTDKNAMLHFQIQNNECQTIHDRSQGMKWATPTDEGEWRSITVSLKSGMNILTWMVYPGDDKMEQGLKKPVMIKYIEITGIAYTSECMKCRPGTMSKAGESECTECKENSYSKKGASECITCDIQYQYSLPGSSECVDMALCTDDDYFAYNSPCDANNMTKKSYNWIQPKICRDGVQGAVSLPSDSDPEPCPPCNPGMEMRNKTCQFCPANKYSDGTGQCEACPGSTAPKNGMVYKWWNSLPDNANISAYCLSMAERGCASESGWQPGLDHIHSGMGHADDVYLVLTLKVGGFQGKEQILKGKAVPLAEVTFTFSTECSADCSFIFMTQNSDQGTFVVKTWEGEQSRGAFSYKVTSTEPISLIWAYQKIDVTDESEMHNKATYRYKEDRAIIYNINVTNTIYGGATSCQLCPAGADQEGCIPCLPGQIVNPETNECTQCPPHTIARGQSSCEPCGSGLKTTDNVKCETMCKVHSTDGKEYDFTSLAGIQTVEGTRLFTSGGTPYFHLFNMSLCGGSYNFPMVSCADNITFPGESLKQHESMLNGTNITESSMNDANSTDIGDLVDDVPEEHEIIMSTICRSTIIPPVPDQNAVMSAQPVSVGDILVNITTDSASMNMDTKMEEAGFQKDEADMDVHFVYVSDMATAACTEGRTTIITMRCDPAQSGTGTIQLPPRCSDGTCDGCNFHFLWRSKKACPVCKKADYKEMKGECLDGQQNITFIPPKHCMLMENEKALNKQQSCTVKWPQWLTIVVYGVPVLVILVIFFIILTIYCCMKNRNLEYKYMKLAANSGDKEGNYDQLPEAETCALEDGEEEQYDDVHFMDKKGGKFFNKLKNLGAKKEDNPFEDVKLSEKIPLT